MQFIITVLHEPQLLILDEPFSGFDPNNADLLKREIMELRDQGHTILFSTHNMASVEEICDNIALIDHSKVVLSGDVDDVKNRYKDNTYYLVIPAEAELQGVEILSQEQKRNKKYLVVRKPAEETNSQFVNSLTRQTEILSFTERIPSMDEIFLRVVRNGEIK